MLILTQFALETTEVLNLASNGGAIVIREEEMLKVSGGLGLESLPSYHSPKQQVIPWSSPPGKGKVKPVGFGDRFPLTQSAHKG